MSRSPESRLEIPEPRERELGARLTEKDPGSKYLNCTVRRGTRSTPAEKNHNLKFIKVVNAQNFVFNELLTIKKLLNSTTIKRV